MSGTVDEAERDWVDDETMSAEETLRRFEALNPQATRGPRAGEHVFTVVPVQPSTDDNKG